MLNHERDNCKGSHTCSMCGLLVSKNEVWEGNHNCFNTLSVQLNKMLSEKDQLIKVLKDEIARKNMTIRQLIDTQISMEQRLAKIEQVLWFEDQTSLMKLKVS
mmetsp:Transcript_12615/g.12428  ORF Transcript_12615/g.12428 Transcript_12615/m.12428 type:complete len:103 (-) Transcript_12615:486-794(-)